MRPNFLARNRNNSLSFQLVIRAFGFGFTKIIFHVYLRKSEWFFVD